MAVATFSRRNKDGAKKRLRTSLLQSKLLLVSLIRLSILKPKIRVIINDVVIAPSFFFSAQFCFVISSRTFLSVPS